MKGLGDNIYQRPFVRMLARREPVYITTPWPELYEDLTGVHFGRSSTVLRTQQKNLDRQSSRRWSSAPTGARLVQIGRASCRESVWQYGLISMVAVAVNIKT